MTAGRHANPSGERAAHDWRPWSLPIGVAAAALGLTAFLFAATAAAPKIPAPAALEQPTQPPSAAKGIRGVPSLAMPSIGADGAWNPDTATPTERTHLSWPPAASASAPGPVSPKPTAPRATTTSAPSRVSTATAAPVSVRTPQESPREQVGAFSGAPTVPSGTPGSSTPTGFTPSTPPASQPEPTPGTPPEPTPTEPTATDSGDLIGELADDVTQTEETE